MPDEQELLRAAKGGDLAALESLIKIHQDDVYRFSRRLAWPDAELAKDIAQDALVIACQRLRSFRGDSTFRTWLFGITLNTHRSHIRKLKRAHQAESRVLVGVTDMNETSGQSPTDADTADLINRAFEQLPSGQREALYLREILGLTYDEVASVLHISLTATKNRIHHGKRAMRAEITRLTQEPGTQKSG